MKSWLTERWIRDRFGEQLGEYHSTSMYDALKQNKLRVMNTDVEFIELKKNCPQDSNNIHRKIVNIHSDLYMPPIINNLKKTERVHSKSYRYAKM